MKIIPAINAKNKKDLLDKLNRVSFVNLVHIDIMDGKFVPARTIQAKEVNSIKKSPKLQIHLMTLNPAKQLAQFKNKRIKEFIVHVESEKEITTVIEQIKRRKIKSGVAFNPETKVGMYSKAIKKSSIALVMTVHPGYSGQKMIPGCLSKVKQITKINKKIKVGVDGGVNRDNIKNVNLAGCSFVAVTSAIFSAKDAKKAVKELEK